MCQAFALKICSLNALIFCGSGLGELIVRRFNADSTEFRLSQQDNDPIMCILSVCFQVKKISHMWPCLHCSQYNLRHQPETITLGSLDF